MSIGQKRVVIENFVEKRMTFFFFFFFFFFSFWHAPWDHSEFKTE